MKHYLYYLSPISSFDLLFIQSLKQRSLSFGLKQEWTATMFQTLFSMGAMLVLIMLLALFPVQQFATIPVIIISNTCPRSTVRHFCWQRTFHLFRPKTKFMGNNIPNPAISRRFSPPTSVVADDAYRVNQENIAQLKAQLKAKKRRARARAREANNYNSHPVPSKFSRPRRNSLEVNNRTLGCRTKLEVNSDGTECVPQCGFQPR